MDREFLIRLTSNLYRLTLLFPKKEPLRYKIREVADEILVKSLRIINEAEFRINGHSIASDLEILDSFFEVAKSQNWVSPSDFLEIQRDYDRLRKEIMNILDITYQALGEPRQSVREIQVSVDQRQERQEKILNYLRNKGRAQVWELKQIFPDVSKRTLRRDFESLLNEGLIERIGEKNETFYQLKDRT